MQGLQPMSMTFYKLLEGRFKARYGVIWIQTYDFRRAYDQLKAVSYEEDYNLYKWSCVEGLMELGLTMDTVLSIGEHVKEGRQVLTEILRRLDEYDNEIFVLEGFQDFIHYADIKVLLQKLAYDLPRASKPKHLVLLSPKVVMPEELARFIDVLALPGASEQEYVAMVEAAAKEHQVSLDFERISAMVTAIKGLTELEAQAMLRLTGVETAFGDGALEVLRREKARIDGKMVDLGIGV